MSARAPESAPPVIVVTGAGVVTAAARGRAAFRAALAEPVGTPRTRIEGFDTSALPDAKSLRRATAHAVYGVAAAVEALAEAGDSVAPEESGLLLASTLGAVGSSYRLWKELVKSGPLGASPMLFSEGVPNALAGHVARLLQLLGPGHMLGGASDSGLRALSVARDVLESGRARRMVVGASEEWSDVAERAYVRFGVMQRAGGTRTDRGLLFSEGAAMLVLERRDDAEPAGAARPALATLRAVESVQLSSLRGEAAADELAALLERTCAAARVRPSELFWMSAANGTAADRLEAAALARVAASGAGAPRGRSGRVRALCGEAFSVSPLLQVIEAFEIVAAGEPAAVLSLSPFAGATLAVFASPPASARAG